MKTQASQKVSDNFWFAR